MSVLSDSRRIYHIHKWVRINYVANLIAEEIWGSLWRQILSSEDIGKAGQLWAVESNQLLPSPIRSEHTMSTPWGPSRRDQWPHHCSMHTCRLLRRSAQHYMRSTDKWHPFSFRVSKYGFEPTSLPAIVDIWEFSKVWSHQSAGIDISPSSAANIAPIRNRGNSLDRMSRLMG